MSTQEGAITGVSWYVAATKAQAIRALKRRRRTYVHSFRGMMGADWETAAAVQAVETAQQVAWTYHWSKHELLVRLDDGTDVHFDVQHQA